MNQAYEPYQTQIDIAVVKTSKLIKSVILSTVFVLTGVHAQDFLTEEEILEQIVGRTHKGIYAGDGTSKFEEFYVPNKKGGKKGNVKGIWKGFEKYSGRWRVKDGMFCLSYPGGEGNGCWRVVVQGDTVLWYPKGKEEHDGYPTTMSD
jgi:hypothetical protein